jgi:hypothetical protein
LDILNRFKNNYSTLKLQAHVKASGSVSGSPLRLRLRLRLGVFEPMDIINYINK